MNKELDEGQYFVQKRGLLQRGRDILHLIRQSPGKLRDLFPQREVSPLEQHQALFRKVNRLALLASNYDKATKPFISHGSFFDPDEEVLNYNAAGSPIKHESHAIILPTYTVGDFSVEIKVGIMAFRPLIDKEGSRKAQGILEVRMSKGKEAVAISIAPQGGLLLVHQQKPDQDSKGSLTERLLMYQYPQVYQGEGPDLLLPNSSQMKFINQALGAGMKAARM